MRHIRLFALLLGMAIPSAAPAAATATPAALRTAAEAGDAEAQFALGEAYRMGRGVTTDREIALGWYRRAAAQGHLGARDALGLLLFARGDRAQAMPLLEAAADRGDPRALYFLATAHFNGDFAARDWPLAYAQMSRAAATGFPPAKLSLIKMGQYLLPADRAKADALLADPTRWTKPRANPAPPPAPAPTPRTQPPTPAAPPVSAKPPPPPPAKPAAGTWRVQLGAYGSAERAEAGWRVLTAKTPALARLRHVIVPSGTIQRLQADGLADKAEAESLCRTLHDKGGGCFVVSL